MRTSLGAIVITTVAFLAHTLCKVFLVGVCAIYDFLLSFIVVEVASPAHSFRKCGLLFVSAIMV